MRTRAKLLVTLAAAVVGLTSAELAARFLRPRLPRPPTTEGELLQPSEDPRLRFEARPGARSRIVYFDSAGGVDREVLAEVNAQGFRGRVVSEKKPEGVLRIAAVGDSHTFGTGVRDDEPWPAALERALAARPGLPRCEVMNCGVSGFDTEEVMAWLESRVLPYEPDLVLYALFPNDTGLRGLQERPEESEQGFWMKLCTPGRGGTIGWLRGHSVLADVVASGLYQRLLLRQWSTSQKRLFSEDFEGWVRARAAILRGRDAARARGARFAVILFPFVLRVDDRMLSEDANRALAPFCEREGIPYFDAEPLFYGVDMDRLRANARDLHAGAEAHRMVGEGVARWLETAELLGTGAGR